MIMGKVLTAGRRRKAREGSHKPGGALATDFGVVVGGERRQTMQIDRNARMGTSHLGPPISGSMKCIDIFGLWCSFAGPILLEGVGFGARLKTVFLTDMCI